MNIDDLTIGQAKALAAQFGEGSACVSKHVGKKCIIRTYASGVHFGTVTEHKDRMVELANARRLWRFDVEGKGISLSEVALHGSFAERSRICETVPEMTVLDALEIIPCSDTAILVIESAAIAGLNDD